MGTVFSIMLNVPEPRSLINLITIYCNVCSRSTCNHVITVSKHQTTTDMRCVRCVVMEVTPLIPRYKFRNVHDITVSAGDRTNNFAESWNRRFETMIGHKSPSIWTIIEVLGDDAAEAATTLLRHNSGRLEPRRVKNCVRDFNKRLQRLCAEYDSGNRDIKRFICMLSATAYD